MRAISAVAKIWLHSTNCRRVPYSRRETSALLCTSGAVYQSLVPDPTQFHLHRITSYTLNSLTAHIDQYEQSDKKCISFQGLSNFPVNSCTDILPLKWKKNAQRDANTAAGCSNCGAKIFFAPPQTPFTGAHDGQNLISWRWSLPLATNPVWWGLMHAISSHHGNRPTHTHTKKPRQDQLQYATPLSLARNVTTAEHYKPGNNIK